MKILCVIDSLGSGGAQRQLVNLAIAFREKEHDVSFLVYHSDPFYYDLLKKHDISIVEILEKSHVNRLLKMRKVIRNGKYDSVLSFLEVASFICEVSGFPYRNWRLIVGERSANPGIFKSFKLRFYRLFHLFADVVAANSYANLELVKKANPLLHSNKLQVIYNLIDFEKWQPAPEKYTFRKNGKFNLIVVASHQYLKNLAGLVEAVNLLNDKEKSQLIINWYGGDRQDNSKIDALDRINEHGLNEVFNFHEPTLDIATKVNEADALGLFSFYEGLPNAVCEAMVISKPVIASNVSDIHLLIDNNYIFNSNNELEISEVLKNLLNLKEKELASIAMKNRARAIDLFDKDLITQKYLKLLK